VARVRGELAPVLLERVVLPLLDALLPGGRDLSGEVARGGHDVHLVGDLRKPQEPASRVRARRDGEVLAAQHGVAVPRGDLRGEPVP
jgi:hypothetical protein